MANGDDADALPGTPDDQGQGGPPGVAPGGPPGGSPPPMGGGPVLAALARRGAGPPVSAPGPGNMAQGLMMLKQASDILTAALPNLDPGSPPHKDALRSLTTLSRHLPQGAPTAGVQQTQIGDMLRNTVRNALLQKIMQQRGGQGGGQGGPSPGMPPQAPQPSTPLPGA